MRLGVPAQRAYRLFPAAIALLTLIAFLPTLQNGFVSWDDQTNFVLNPNFRGLDWTHLKWMWTSHLLGRYVPIAWMTLGLDYCIWGLNPLGYHLTSVLWHVANAVAFYFLALALIGRAIPAGSERMRARIPLGASFAALVFALHPLRVESVAWATERRDVVSGLFYLLAILVYVRAAPRLPGQALERRRYWLCFTLFVLAVLSKEMAVTMPAVLLILDVYPLRRLGGSAGGWFGAGARVVWLEKIPFFAVSLAVSSMALYVGFREKLAETLTSVSWLDRLAIVIYGLAFYLRKTLAPIGLSVIYALTPQRLDLRASAFLLSATAVILVAAAAYVLRRRVPALAAVTLAYCVTLIPVSGLFHNGRQIAADRYSYLPCLGWALLAGGAFLRVGVRDWRHGRRIIAGLCGVVVIALAVLTCRQSQVWRDSDTLWSHAVAIEPSYVTHTNMGNLLAQEGDNLWAIDHLRQATVLKPDYGPAHINLGSSLLAVGRTDEAAGEFQKALALGQNREYAENGLACALSQQGKSDEAIRHFREALRINPGYKDAQSNLERELAKKPSPLKP